MCLTEPKRLKYINAIAEWNLRRTHTLNEVQKFHGKLIHAALVFPDSCPYLINIEAMLTIFGDKPFLPRTPPCGTQDDIKWWLNCLSNLSHPLSISSPQSVVVLNAFSNTSSSIRIGILLNGLWHAWILRPGWKSGGRDIGWAKSVSFELLILTILHSGTSNIDIKVFGDNQNVINGWAKGRSHNRPTNDIFKCIHSALAPAHCTIHARYICSEDNPADPLSHGIYPPLHLLIPPFPVPDAILPFIADFNDPSATSNHLAMS